MSRSFSLLLITLGLAILGSLVYLHFYLMERQHASLFDHASTVNERIIEQKREEVEMLHMTTKEFFLDDIYTNRSFILNIFTEAELRLKEYFDALGQFDHPPAETDVQSLAIMALSPVLDTAIQVFQRHHLQLDMREEEMQELVNGFKKMRPGWLCSFTPTPFPSQAFQLEKEVITMELLADFSDLLYRVASLGCYRGFEIDTFFPIVTKGSNYVKAGKSIELKMAIGSYSSALDPDNVVLIADGDTVRIGDDGTGDYSLRSGSRGEHTIKTKCIVTNPLTGGVKVGEGSYTYRSY